MRAVIPTEKWTVAVELKGVARKGFVAQKPSLQGGRADIGPNLELKRVRVNGGVVYDADVAQVGGGA